MDTDQPKFMFRHEPDGSFRVWRSDWAGDQFDVLTAEEFHTRSETTPMEEAPFDD